MGTLVKNIRGWWRVDWDDATFDHVRLREHNKHEWFMMQGAADEARIKPLLSSSLLTCCREQGVVENGVGAGAGGERESVAQEKSVAEAPETPSGLLRACAKCIKGRHGLQYCLRLGHKGPPATTGSSFLIACAKCKQGRHGLQHCLRLGHAGQHTNRTQAPHTHARQRAQTETPSLGLRACAKCKKRGHLLQQKENTF